MSVLTRFFASKRIVAISVVAVLALLATLHVAELYAINVIHRRQVEGLIILDRTQQFIVQSNERATHKEMMDSLVRLSIFLDHVLPAEGDAFQQAVALRNAIYQSVSLLKNSDDFDFSTFDASFKKSTQDIAAGQLCGGLTILYMAALEARGIPARYVGMFSNKSNAAAGFDSHAAVEFFANGRWLASDPTFNVMYARRGRFLSYAELYDALRDGKPYDVVGNGFPQKKGRPTGEAIPQIELMTFLVVDPVQVYDTKLDRLKHYRMLRRPQSWNGMIAFGGKEMHVGHNSDSDNQHQLYQFLESGPLR